MSINLNDSFEFLLVNIEQLEVQNKKYPGYRLNMQVNLGKTKDRLQVDLGVGDKRPNLFPIIFGYHEVFHILVVVGAGSHFMVIHSLV